MALTLPKTRDNRLYLPSNWVLALDETRNAACIRGYIAAKNNSGWHLMYATDVNMWAVPVPAIKPSSLLKMVDEVFVGTEWERSIIAIDSGDEAYHLRYFGWAAFMKYKLAGVITEERTDI